MTAPQQPVIPLEETVKQLTGWLSMEPFDDALALHVRSALHHLEAGKRDTAICDHLDAREVRVQWLDNAIFAEVGGFRSLMKLVMDEAAPNPTPAGMSTEPDEVTPVESYLEAMGRGVESLIESLTLTGNHFREFRKEGEVLASLKCCISELKIHPAITLLSPTPCECDTAKNYVHFALGGAFLGELEDAVKFCPWCGHPVPQPETKSV